MANPQGRMAEITGSVGRPYGYQLIRGSLYRKIFNRFIKRPNIHNDPIVKQLDLMQREDPAGWDRNAQRGDINIGNTYTKDMFDRIQNAIGGILLTFLRVHGKDTSVNPLRCTHTKPSMGNHTIAQENIRSRCNPTGTRSESKV